MSAQPSSSRPGVIGTDREQWDDVAARRWQGATASMSSLATSDRGIRQVWGDRKPSIATWMALLKSLDPLNRERVVDALPGGGLLPDRRHLDHLMTPGGLRALKRKGHVVGSHSISHPLLPQLGAAALEAELVENLANCSKNGCKMKSEASPIRTAIAMMPARLATVGMLRMSTRCACGESTCIRRARVA